MMKKIMGPFRGIVFGFANRYSLAWKIVEALLPYGGEITVTYQNERVKKNIQKLDLKTAGKSLTFLPCDVQDVQQVKAVCDHAGGIDKSLDFIVHSIAFAPTRAFDNPLYSCTSADFAKAMDISVHSLMTVTRYALPYLTAGKGSVLTLTYLGSERVLPGYHIMGVAKAALEASVRYLSYELGAHGVRINALSPGPVHTLSAGAIPEFSRIREIFKARSAFKRDMEAEELADTALFFVSPLSRGITGQVVYVDHNYNRMGI